MNKVIVVTGGTKGIGLAVIEKFASQHFDIVTCARNAKDLEVLKESIEKKFPVKVMSIATNMGDKIQVRAFADFVLSFGCPVEVLVNNAGIFISGEICSEPEGQLESMINTNVYSAYNLTRGLIGGMKEKKSGHIFNICSIASFMAYANGGSYAISKFAMLGFSKCLREELKQFNIRVTAVMPGATKTRSWDSVDLPDDRFMPSEDIAETIFSAYSLSSRSVIEEIIIRPQLGDI